MKFKPGDVIIHNQFNGKYTNIELIVGINSQYTYLGFDPNWSGSKVDTVVAQIVDNYYGLITDSIIDRDKVQNIIDDIKHQYKIHQLTEIIEK